VSLDAELDGGPLEARLAAGAASPERADADERELSWVLGDLRELARYVEVHGGRFTPRDREILLRRLAGQSWARITDVLRPVPRGAQTLTGDAAARERRRARNTIIKAGTRARDRLPTDLRAALPDQRFAGW
jgi:hypothetical protein